MSRKTIPVYFSESRESRYMKKLVFLTLPLLLAL